MTQTLTRATPARERLLARLVPQPNGCWHWTGLIDPCGYGRLGYKGVTCYVGRHGHPPVQDSPFSHRLTDDELAQRALKAWDARGRQPCGTRASYRRGCRCAACVDAQRTYSRERAAS